MFLIPETQVDRLPVFTNFKSVWKSAHEHPVYLRDRISFYESILSDNLTFSSISTITEVNIVVVLILDVTVKFHMINCFCNYMFLRRPSLLFVYLLFVYFIYFLCL